MNGAPWGSLLTRPVLIIVGVSLVAGLLLGRCTSPGAPATQTVGEIAPTTSVKILPLEVRGVWPNIDLEYPQVIDPKDTLLGSDHDHSKESKIGYQVRAYELVAELLGERWSKETRPTTFSPSWCRFNIPILDVDYNAPLPDDGCGGCEGRPGRVLGYRDFCGTWRFYTLEDCNYARLSIGQAVIRNTIAAGPWGQWEGVRLSCAAVTTDVYPIAWAEDRDSKALRKARVSR